MELPPNKIALVLDGVVQDVFHTDDRMAAILLSSPVILDVSSQYAGQPETFNMVNWEYKDGEFFSKETLIIQPTSEV